METDPDEKDSVILLGCPFMATTKAVINVHEGKLTLKVLDEVVEYKVFESLVYPIGAHDYYSVDILDDIEEEANMRVCYQEVVDEVITEDSGVENGLVEQRGSDKDEPSPKKLELKELPSNLKYAFLDDSQAFPIIIAANLDPSEEQRLLVILRKYKKSCRMDTRRYQRN